MTNRDLYTLGRRAIGKVRSARRMWSSLAGDETEAIRAEYSIGRDTAAVVRQRSSCTVDPPLQTLLDEICDRLAGVVRNKRHRFEVGVVTDEQPGAYALLGGFVFLTRSLVDLCERDRDDQGGAGHRGQRAAEQLWAHEQGRASTSSSPPPKASSGIWRCTRPRRKTGGARTAASFSCARDSVRGPRSMATGATVPSTARSG